MLLAVVEQPAERQHAEKSARDQFGESDLAGK